MVNFYFHSLRKNVNTLESILKNGAILSREKLGIKGNYYGYNGNKWISVCAKTSLEDKIKHLEEMEDRVRIAYDYLVVNGLVIVLNNSINAVKTSYMPYDSLYDGMLSDDSSMRFSDCIDEYQVRDIIKADDFVAIGYPYSENYQNNKEKTKIEIEKIKDLLRKYNYSFEIIDSSHDKIDKELGNLKKVLIK